jgi:hypothetical protein
MQISLRCKRVSKLPEPLDEDPTIDANRCKRQDWLKNSMRWWEGLSNKITSTIGSSSKGPEGLLACLHLTPACILVLA